MRTDRQIREQITSLRRELRERKAERLGTVIRKGRGCRDRDEELKKQRGYTDPSSFVRRDGSEKLVGEDWRKRKEELRQRSGGRCEKLCLEGVLQSDGTIRCRNDARDADHKVKRSARRDDRMSNLEDLCGYHHDVKHPEFKPQFKGSPKFSESLGDA